jgi:hypothetical protein
VGRCGASAWRRKLRDEVIDHCDNSECIDSVNIGESPALLQAKTCGVKSKSSSTVIRGRLSGYVVTAWLFNKAQEYEFGASEMRLDPPLFHGLAFSRRVNILCMDARYCQEQWVWISSEADIERA